MDIIESLLVGALPSHSFEKMMLGKIMTGITVAPTSHRTLIEVYVDNFIERAIECEANIINTF